MIWTTGHEEWGPRLVAASLVFFFLSIVCLLCPWLKKKLARGTNTPDMPISDAINYLVNDSTAKLKQPKSAEIEQFGRVKGLLVNFPGIAHADALRHIQTALNCGSLKAWGRREIAPNSLAFEPSSRPILPEYWGSAWVNDFFCFHEGEQAQTAPFRGKMADRYAALTLNKNEVKALWTPVSFPRRFLMDMRIIRRKDRCGRAIDRKYKLTKSEIERFNSLPLAECESPRANFNADFNEAARRFREAFHPVLARLEARSCDDGSPDAYELLEDAFQRLGEAVIEFRNYVPSDQRAAFEKAWEELRKDEYSIASGLEERNFKQYADEATGVHDEHPREPHKAAIDRIEKLLDFAALRVSGAGL